MEQEKQLQDYLVRLELKITHDLPFEEMKDEVEYVLSACLALMNMMCMTPQSVELLGSNGEFSNLLEEDCAMYNSPPEEDPDDDTPAA